MGRIRTIKPELPQSESLGNVSRDARLTFILLWTMADDEGRLRAASRMLASLLFPYDDDAPGHIDEWLDELSEVGCITRYQIDGASYIQIDKWLEHQKIDHPKESKIPAPSEDSRSVANVREKSPRTKEGTKDQGGDQGRASAEPLAKPPRKSKLPEDWEPDQTDRDYAMGRRLDPDVLKTKFRDHHLAHGKTMVDWHAAWRTWCQNEAKWAKPGDPKPEPPPAAKAEARRKNNEWLAGRIKLGHMPDATFSPQRARELITAGLITADDATKVGCPING